MNLRGVKPYIPAARSCFRTSSSRRLPILPAAKPPMFVASSSKRSNDRRFAPSDAVPTAPGSARKPYHSTLASVLRTWARWRPTAWTHRPVAPATKRRPISNMMSTPSLLLDLDVDDLFDDERPGDDHHRRGRERDLAGGRHEKRFGVRGIDYGDEAEEDDRQPAHDPTSHPALGRQRLDETPDVEARPDRLDHAIQHLGHVPARVPLELGYERDLLDLGTVHPARDLAQRILDRHAELLVRDDALEFTSRRRLGVCCDDRERADEAVAG